VMRLKCGEQFEPGHFVVSKGLGGGSGAMSVTRVP
jgi:hypothetical protein